MDLRVRASTCSPSKLEVNLGSPIDLPMVAICQLDAYECDVGPASLKTTRDPRATATASAPVLPLVQNLLQCCVDYQRAVKPSPALHEHRAKNASR